MTLDHPAEKAPYLRPKDAASILLMDRSTPRMRVLMGKRSSAHVFMPDVYVFPGGKRDREDSTLPFASDLHPVVLDNLMRASSSAVSQRRARALALAALRELHEETGLRFRSDEQGSTGPDLSCLRFVARAITPPGRIRRYDTRFFCCFTDEVGIEPMAARDSDELQHLEWLDIQDNSGVNMAPITRMVLEDVTKFVIGDRSLQFESPVRQYFERRGTFTRGFL